MNTATLMARVEAGCNYALPLNPFPPMRKPATVGNRSRRPQMCDCR